MEQVVHALMEHKLTPENILNLPDHLLRNGDNILSGQWHWTTPNMNEQALKTLWTYNAEYFINNSWSVADLALLEKDNLAFHFFTPHLVTFTTTLQWGTYLRNEQLRTEFNHLTKTILSLLNVVDILIVPDLSSVDFFYEEEDLTVDAFRKKANGNNMYAIELA